MELHYPFKCNRLSYPHWFRPFGFASLSFDRFAQYSIPTDLIGFILSQLNAKSKPFFQIHTKKVYFNTNEKKNALRSYS